MFLVETFISFVHSVSLCRSEEEPAAGRADDRQWSPGETTLYGCLLQSQRGALPQHPLCPRPQGAPVSPLQTSEDCSRCTKGSGGCNRCLKPSVLTIMDSSHGFSDFEKMEFSMCVIILSCF